MSKALEHMLLSNNTELHGILKIMYQQWQHTEIIDITIGIIIAIILIILEILWFKSLRHKYQTVKSANTDFDDSFINWLVNHHMISAVGITSIGVLTIALILVLIFNIINFCLNPYMFFVQTLIPQ